jgi:flavodoxin
MSDRPEDPEIKRLIVAAIYKHTRAGNVEEVAQAIVAELREAGFEIQRSGPSRGETNSTD